MLDEEKVDFALRRAEELGVWPAVHGRLRVDASTRAAGRRADELRAAHALGGGGVRAGGCASSGCYATSTRRRSPPGRSACACAARTLACSPARRSSPGAFSTASRAARARRNSTTWRPRSPRGGAGGDDARRVGRRRRPPGALPRRHASRAPGDPRRRPHRARLHLRARAWATCLRSVLHLKLNGVVAGRLGRARGRRTDAGERVNDSSLLVQFLIISPLLIISLVLHELAHGWVAYLLGDPTAKAHGRLTLNPIRHLDLWGTIILAVTYLGSGGQLLLRLRQAGAG